MGVFLPVCYVVTDNPSFSPILIRRRLIFELICESITFYAFRNPDSAYQCFIFASIETPQYSVASPYHVFLEEHMHS